MQPNFVLRRVKAGELNGRNWIAKSFNEYFNEVD